jgi:hypothetical protein
MQQHSLKVVRFTAATMTPRTKNNKNNKNKNNNEQQKLGMIRRGRNALSLVMIFAMSVGMLGAWMHLDLSHMISSTADTFNTFVPNTRCDYGRLDDHHNGPVAPVQTTKAVGMEGNDDDAHHAADSSSSSSSSSAITTDSAVEEVDNRDTNNILKEQDDEQGQQSDPPASPLNLVICTRVR